MDKVKFGMIGAGNIGQLHIRNFMEGKIKDGELVAVADLVPEKLDASKLQDVTFSGDCVLGSFNGSFEFPGGVKNRRIYRTATSGT